jgi:ribonuclease HI
MKEGQPVERSTPCYRRATPWATPVNPTLTYHAWTDGSFRKSAGLGWIITEDDMGRGPIVAQGSKTLGDKQTAFDVELTAVEAALLWYKDNYTTHPHLIIHSDSQSAIARSEHCGAGPGERSAKSMQKILVNILRHGRSANIVWVKGHRHPGKRKGGQTSRTGCRESSLVTNCLPLPPQTMYIREIQRSQDGMAPRPETPRHRLLEYYVRILDMTSSRTQNTVQARWGLRYSVFLLFLNHNSCIHEY